MIHDNFLFKNVFGTNHLCIVLCLKSMGHTCTHRSIEQVEDTSLVNHGKRLKDQTEPKALVC